MRNDADEGEERAGRKERSAEDLTWLHVRLMRSATSAMWTMIVPGRTVIPSQISFPGVLTLGFPRTHTWASP